MPGRRIKTTPAIISSKKGRILFIITSVTSVAVKSPPVIIYKIHYFFKPGLVNLIEN